jgi:hypothetical protein
MKTIHLTVLMAGLSLLTFKSEAQSWDFQFGYVDAFSTNALQYVVEQQNIQQYNEGDGITYWCPINNGTEAILTQEFTFPQPTSQVFLSTGFYIANFGGGDYGSGSLWGSIDGTNWVLLLDGPTPSITAYDPWFTSNLPNSLIGSTQLWIQARMQSSGWNIMAQFNRYPSVTNYSFELDANYIPPSAPVITAQPQSVVVNAHDTTSFTVTISNEPTASCVSNGLVAYYPFNENVNDVSGNGNNGTNYGATLTTDRFGNTNGAYYFNGSNWIDIGPVVSRYDIMSITAWINTTSLSSFEDEAAIVSKPNDPLTLTGSRLGTYEGAFDSGFASDSASFITYINIVVFGSNPANNGIWQQGVYVNDGTNLQLFVDGQLVGVESYSPQVSTSTEPMFIGKEFPTNWALPGLRYFTGAIDDVRIYNRALSSNEVAQLYTIESQIPITYQWQFNGSNIAGATSSTLMISNVAQTNLGAYAVVVSNAVGSSTSSNATLSMYPFLATPFGGLDTYWGYTNTLSVAAWGTGPLNYQWFDNGNAIDGATNEALTLTGIQFTNAGLYSVVVSSPLGSVTNTQEQVVVNPAGVSFGGLYPSVLIQGVVGYNYIIQSTTNLANTNAWVTVTNLTLIQPIQLYIDSNTDASLPANPNRFYQVLPGQ